MPDLFEIPDWVYLKTTRFVDCDEELITPLLSGSIMGEYVKFSIRGIQVDARLCELLRFANHSGMTLTQVSDLRTRQVRASLTDGAEPELTRYLEFLMNVRL